MRTDNTKSEEDRAIETIPSSGSRMLQPSQQLATRETPGPDELHGVRPEFVLAFFRRLVQNTWSPDVICLSLYAAKNDANATEEEMSILWAACEKERKGPPF